MSSTSTEAELAAAGPATPRRVYEERSFQVDRELVVWRGRDRLTSWARLLTMIAFVVLAWMAVQQQVLSLAWVVLPSALFAVLVVVHERVVRRRTTLERAKEFLSAGLRRLEGDYSAGPTGERHLREGHLFAVDLDLFGPGSMYQLLSRARTQWGEELLAHWLNEPTLEVDELLERQEAVAELSRELDLRQDLATLGGQLETELKPRALAEWAAAPARLASVQWLRFVLPLVAAFNGVAAGGWIFGLWGSRPLLIAGLVEVVVWVALRPRLSESLKGLDRRGRDVALMSDLVLRLENHSFTCNRLRQLQSGLSAGESRSAASAGQSIAQLNRLVDWAESRRNGFFAPFSALFLVATQVSLALERWRSLHGEQVSRWFGIVGEVEALASFGSHAFENPEDPFPTFATSEDPPTFEARELGHPLIRRDQCIGNDLELTCERDAVPQALIVSGSNMSGKSTFLRACGVNLVLALAGAPVRAAALRLTPMTAAASIRTQDSLQDGESRFYAEIVRLRDVLECARSRGPVFFLLDEILHGTNSHDRKIGAAALVRSLVESGGLGLVTTHDLALAEIGEQDSELRNVHFVDHLEGGRVCFDYVLQPGVVTRSNAIELMREVGIDV